MNNMVAKFRKTDPVTARALDEQGWRIEIGKNCHLRFISPTGAVVHASGTPSDNRALKNNRAVLKRYGLRMEKQ